MHARPRPGFAPAQATLSVSILEALKPPRIFPCHFPSPEIRFLARATQVVRTAPGTQFSPPGATFFVGSHDLSLPFLDRPPAPRNSPSAPRPNARIVFYGVVFFNYPCRRRGPAGRSGMGWGGRKEVSLIGRAHSSLSRHAGAEGGAALKN